MIGGIRQVDDRHPTTSEFYQLPHQGVDIPAAIDGLDLCNFGYFGKPGSNTILQVATPLASGITGTNHPNEVALSGSHNLQRISGAANIPLSDNLAFRGTFFASQRDPGQ